MRNAGNLVLGCGLGAEMHLNHTELREWLRRVLDYTGEKPTNLARRAGIAQSTLTRFLHSDDAPLLSTRTIAKIAQAANYSPPGFETSLSGQLVKSITLGVGQRQAEATPFLPNSASTAVDAALKALVGGRNAADLWVLHSEALRDAGYLPGDIMLVDLGMKPEDGELVCAQVYKWSQHQAETVFRFYDPPYLVAATMRRDLRRPLLVDNDRVRITGVVTESLRTSTRLELPSSARM